MTWNKQTTQKAAILKSLFNFLLLLSKIILLKLSVNDFFQTLQKRGWFLWDLTNDKSSLSLGNGLGTIMQLAIIWTFHDYRMANGTTMRLTHYGQNSTVVPTTFLNTWSLECINDFVIRFKFHCRLFIPRGTTDKKSALVQIMAWHQADKILTEPMMTQFTHIHDICVPMLQWVKRQLMWYF